MGVLSNKIDREQLKPGDHIYSWRKAYIYAHHGIYVGDGMVIHFTRGVGEEVGTGTILDRLLDSSVPRHDTSIPCPKCGDPSEKEGVIASCLDCFLHGGNLYLFGYGVSPAFFLANVRGGTCTCFRSDPTEDVLHRASFLLEHGFGDYDLFKKNCEDFAIYCKTGLLVCSGQAASCSAAADAVVKTTIRKMTTSSPVSVLSMVGHGMYLYCANRLASDIGRRQDVFKIPVEILILSPGLNESKKTAEAPVQGLTASPGLNEPEKTSEAPVKMLIASPSLNEQEKTAEVPVESLKTSPGLTEPEKIAEVPVEMPIASPGLNELEKTTKTAEENQHGLNRGFGNRGDRGGGRGRRGRRPSVTCQICLRSGHSAYKCYNRFDYNYPPCQSPQPVFPRGFRPHSAPLAAVPTTPQVLNDKSRLPNSGATNQVTADRENLVPRSEYNGSKQLFVGNGTGLHIARTGTSSFEAERRRKEEAEGLAKLAEKAEKQGQREQEPEEKERQSREALPGRSCTEPASRPSEPPTRPPESGSAAGPARGKYVPRFKREKSDAPAPAAPPPETDRMVTGGVAIDDRRPAFGSGGGSGSSSTWSSSRNHRDR